MYDKLGVYELNEKKDINTSLNRECGFILAQRQKLQTIHPGTHVLMQSIFLQLLFIFIYFIY